MKIKKATLLKVRIPMRNSFATSFGTITDKPTVIIRVESEKGVVGWGEGAALPFPNYNPDFTDSTYLVLSKYILPQVMQKKIDHPSEILNLYSNLKGNNFAKTAIENAVWMIYSLQKNKPISKLIGGIKTKIPVGESVGIKSSIDETLEEIRLRVDEGYRRTKVKIKPGWDIKLVRRIRKEFGNIELMVDGNSAYTLKDLKILKELDKYKLTMIEQPLADDDIIDHITLQKLIKTPICLDESIRSVDDARKAIQMRACKIINIKPGRVGGISESIKIHNTCKKMGVGVWCGGMLESGIGRAFNIAIASLTNFKYPADMSPVSIYYKDDLVKNSFVVDKDGYVEVPKKPGLGFDVDEQKIKKYAVEKDTIS